MQWQTKTPRIHLGQASSFHINSITENKCVKCPTRSPQVRTARVNPDPDVSKGLGTKSKQHDHDKKHQNSKENLPVHVVKDVKAYLHKPQRLRLNLQSKYQSQSSLSQRWLLEDGKHLENIDGQQYDKDG